METPTTLSQRLAFLQAILEILTKYQIKHVHDHMNGSNTWRLEKK
jgi:hypothetical protein